MSVEWLKDLFQPAILLPFLTYVIPGFIVWIIIQGRIPRGEQRFNDALLEILAYGFVNAMIWTFVGRAPITWTAWPTTVAGAALLVATVFATPIIIAILYQDLLNLLVRGGIILPLEPRAWERLFLHVLPKKAYAVLVTLQNGTKLGGAFVGEGYAGMYPYERDLFLGEVWKIDAQGRFEARIRGTEGVYIDKSDILYVELFDYKTIVEAAQEQSHHAK
jgi:hypothetical protein